MILNKKQNTQDEIYLAEFLLRRLFQSLVSMKKVKHKTVWYIYDDERFT